MNFTMETNVQIRVFLVDDQSMIRAGFKSMLGKDPRFRTLDEMEATVRLVSAPFGPLTDAQWRHLTVTGRADPTLCAAHDRMLHVLQGELVRRLGNSVGATVYTSSARDACTSVPTW